MAMSVMPPPSSRGPFRAADMEPDGTSLEGAASENWARRAGFVESGNSSSSSSSRLENLPPELRSKLLSWMPDLPTLRSLVHASPVLHAQYRYSRNDILRACLDRELDGFHVDAYANLMSRARMIGSPRTDEKITEFLDTYHRWLSGPRVHPYVNPTGLGSVRWMAAYHLSVTRPLARLYTEWALTNLQSAATSLPDGGVETQEPAALVEFDMLLTRSEQIRVFRALYRYETYYHLFGINESRRRGSFSDVEVNNLFLCLFDPWEAEAIGCLDLFVRQKYQDLFNKVRWDLDPKNPKFMQDNGVYNPQGSVDLTIQHRAYMEGTISRGLKVLVRLLAIDDHEKLVTKMERCLTHDQYLDARLSTALSSVAQRERRGDSLNARDEAQQRREPVHFIGDAVPPNSPPLAWVLLWGGKYANIYGEYVPHSLRTWGYVVWDAYRWDDEARWNDIGPEELIKKQWETDPGQVEEIMGEYGWSPV